VDREAAAEANDGEGAPVRFGRGEVVWELRGLTAELARVSARVVELRRGGFDGGAELAGVLWMAAVYSGAWERGASKRTSGMECGGFFKARARARRGRRPLQRARHNGGEVAAARAALGSTGAHGRARRGTAQWQRAVGKLRSDAWASRQEVARGGSSPWPAGGALHSGGENRSKELEEGEKDPNEISEISRDQTVKQR
jgi:hypothetical protein